MACKEIVFRHPSVIWVSIQFCNLFIFKVAVVMVKLIVLHLICAAGFDLSMIAYLSTYSNS